MNSTDRNICIFSHFDRHSDVRDYVSYYVQSLVSAGFKVHFVSTADRIKPEDRDRLKAIGAEVYVRENKGIDFGSWQYGLNIIDDYGEIDHLILANDSVFGPLFDLQHLISQMKKSDLDFWGITDSYEKAWHIQSYFLCFNGNVVRSKAFRRFFEKDFPSLSKRDVILQGEIDLSQQLTGAGFRGAASCPYNLLIDGCYDGPLNPTHYYWDRLIERLRCPFLKIQLLRENPRSVSSVSRWRDVLSRETDYDISLIEDQLAAYGEAPPRRSLLFIFRWWAERFPYLLKLVILTASKALRYPTRAVIGLEQFVVADFSKLPSHPGPAPTAGYADLSAPKSPDDE